MASRKADLPEPSFLEDLFNRYQAFKKSTAGNSIRESWDVLKWSAGKLTSFGGKCVLAFVTTFFVTVFPLALAHHRENQILESQPMALQGAGPSGGAPGAGPQ